MTRAVVQHARRCLGFQLQVHGHAVPLVGPEARSIRTEGKTPLVAPRHHPFEVSTPHRQAMQTEGRQQVGHRDPAAGLQLQTEFLRRVAQVVCKG